MFNKLKPFSHKMDTNLKLKTENVLLLYNLLISNLCYSFEPISFYSLKRQVSIQKSYWNITEQKRLSICLLIYCVLCGFNCNNCAWYLWWENKWISIMRGEGGERGRRLRRSYHDPEVWKNTITMFCGRRPVKAGRECRGVPFVNK